MEIDALKELLEQMSDQDLFRFLRRSICKSFIDIEHHHNDLSDELDVVFSECQRRGKERLYDKIYESICNDPNLCKTG